MILNHGKSCLDLTIILQTTNKSRCFIPIIPTRTVWSEYTIAAMATTFVCSQRNFMHAWIRDTYYWYKMFLRGQTFWQKFHRKRGELSQSFVHVSCADSDKSYTGQHATTSFRATLSFYFVSFWSQVQNSQHVTEWNDARIVVLSNMLHSKCCCVLSRLTLRNEDVGSKRLYSRL